LTDIFDFRVGFLPAQPTVQFSRFGRARVSALFGGDSEGATPLPIPNREVKPLSADGTWASRPWESRSPPVLIQKGRLRAALSRGGLVRRLPRVSTLGIVLIVLGVVVLLLLVGGLAGARKRDRLQGPALERSIAEADRALEQARAADKGWDRAVLEAVCRKALEAERPELRYERLELVLVDDRPGVDRDRAHFVAGGSEGEARVILARQTEGWAAERVD
jgi:hypothetical protein